MTTPLVSNGPQQRALKTKRRTGCKTCKARRIKCGEERPVCRKCVSTGRRCEGYEANVAHIRSNSSGSRAILPRWSSVFTHQSLPNTVSSLPGGLRAEDRVFFDVFLWQTSLCLPDEATNLWQSLVLRMGHAEPALTSAIVAVGAMHHTRAHATPLGLGLLGFEQERHDHALHHYTKATQVIQHYIDTSRNDSSTILVVLLSCLMFMSFEMLQDRDDLATDHLRAGLRILHNHVGWKSNKSNMMKVPYVPDKKSDMELLLELFVRLDCESTMLGEYEPMFALVSKENGSPIAVPERFQSISDAHFHLDVLTNVAYTARGALMRYSGVKFSGPLEETSPHWSRDDYLMDACSRSIDLKDNYELLFQLKEAERAVSSWSLALTRTTVPPISSPSYPRWLLLQIHFFVVWIQVSTWRSASACAYDRFAEYYPQALDRVELLLQGWQRTAGFISNGSSHASYGRSRFFGLSGSILLALHFVAVKCRDTAIRYKAIKLLANANFQESAFDSRLLAVYTLRIVELEEEAARLQFGSEAAGLECLTPTDVPEHGRFLDVAIRSDLEHLGLGILVCSKHDQTHHTGFATEEHRFDIADAAVRLEAMGF